MTFDSILIKKRSEFLVSENTTVVKQELLVAIIGAPVAQNMDQL